MTKKNNSKALSSSLKAGSIALVFLVLGYQAAIFIHKAAVTRIISNRDEPDTVYIYQSEPASPDPDLRSASQSISPTEKRKNARHSPAAEKVREEHPSREAFRFNPNTVSVEDLQRLGFTLKQAQSIDNYRQKGGHFNRKSDFAKSFVVSEETYDRLKDYIDIPLLDLNKADSVALVSLPGIGGWFASQIIRHRAELGGYSRKEQLLNIYRMDEERFGKIADLVFVRQEDAVPFRIWTLPADSLRNHPYIRNKNTARAIVLYRENNPPEDLSLEGLLKAGVLNMEQYEKLSRCLLAGVMVED